MYCEYPHAYCILYRHPIRFIQSTCSSSFYYCYLSFSFSRLFLLNNFLLPSSFLLHESLFCSTIELDILRCDGSTTLQLISVACLAIWKISKSGKINNGRKIWRWNCSNCLWLFINYQRIEIRFFRKKN